MYQQVYKEVDQLKVIITKYVFLFNKTSSTDRFQSGALYTMSR